MQTSILDILNVVIMMRMTYASFKQFYENVDMSMLWSIWSPWRNERGATATITKMVPRQHSDDPTTHWDTSAKESVDVRYMQKKVGWSRIPGSHGSTAWQMRRKLQGWFGHGANISDISYNTHSYTSGHLGVIPSKRAFGAERVRSGSSCSRVVGEVVVLATVVEVVVHVS